jgi:hypothetical protein
MKFTRHQLKKLIQEALGFTPAATDMFVLIGPPSIGKSTWIGENIPNAYIVSSDEVTEAVAAAEGMSYDDMFEYPPQPTLRSGEANPNYDPTEIHPRFGKVVDQGIDWKSWMPKAYEKVNTAEIQALKKLEQVKQDAKTSGKPIVIDMTNMNVGSRKRIIDEMIRFTGINLRKIGVVFEFAGAEEDIKATAASRNILKQMSGHGPKTIPDIAFDRMMGGYQPPAEGEFDKVIHVDNRGKVKDFHQSNIQKISMLGRENF